MSDSETDNIIPFSREVAKYFMDFLETDFHKRRIPSRRVKMHNQDNLLLGLDLSKYSKFKKELWQIAQDNDFGGGIIIKKGDYTSNVPEEFTEILEERIDRIEEKKVNELTDSIENIINEAYLNNKAKLQKFENATEKEIKEEVENQITDPLFSDLKESLLDLDSVTDITFRMMQEELTEILSAGFLEERNEFYKKLDNDEEVHEILQAITSLEKVKEQLDNFFLNYSLSDLFQELHELKRNREILDKQELYFYFCNISFEGVKYPIFYIPFSLKKKDSGNKFELSFDSQFYLNKRALRYIEQEYNQKTDKKGRLGEIDDRIIYLADYENGSFTNRLQEIINEIVNFFDLNSKIELDNHNKQKAISGHVKVTNEVHINLFDKSDEALINDYESILELLDAEENVIGDAFEGLVDDFIREDEPDSYNQSIEEDWQQKSIPNKLVFESPIPLNAEQRKIMSALEEQGCDYTVVEGPPGTGKSHTITAVLFRIAQQGKSALVLSDKKEALDVVEDKITKTLDEVRPEENFQNPILRLGKTGDNYRNILSRSSMQSIKNSYAATKNNYNEIKSNIDQQKEELISKIKEEGSSYEEIDFDEVIKLLKLRRGMAKEDFVFNFEELIEAENSYKLIGKAQKILIDVRELLNYEEVETFLKLFNFEKPRFKDLSSLNNYVKALIALKDQIENLQDNFGEELKILNEFQTIEKGKKATLDSLISEAKDLKKLIIGYLFEQEELDDLNKQFNDLFPRSNVGRLEDNIGRLEKLSEIILFIESLDEEFDYDWDLIRILSKLVIDKEALTGLNKLVDTKKELSTLQKISQELPESFSFLQDTLLENRLIDMSEDKLNRAVEYVKLEQKIPEEFKDVPGVDYFSNRESLENLLATQMTYLLDKRVVNFWEEEKKTAKTLRDIIRNKKKFPRKEFSKLREAFPCILAGIRDYAEYIPLEPNIFDVVIIDEASQVSIAQALPALIRAKKVLILGDPRQFSNVKSSQAKTDINKNYLNQVRNTFKNEVSEEKAQLERVERFNIKTSILDFVDYIGNYDTQLRKHFRGYKELISFSNKHVYNNSLEVMKVRGKNIEDVLEFERIEPQRETNISNTNLDEINSIISNLQQIKSKDKKPTVGIITPHRNQQKLISKKISELENADYYFDELDLKIMTFDTCQGEERDIVFYSMVATPEDDKLNYVFSKRLNNFKDSLRAQRLNVGLSRAKERMYFLLSKPIGDYPGGIGKALRHFKRQLKQAKEEKGIEEVDSRSPMEEQVLNWFYQTDFWKENQGHIEFRPQFEVGEYLKQLDPNYNHPMYVVDFLLTYKKANKEQKIIIEYDGFREHFEDFTGINKNNYQQFYSDEDVYRQKVLEGYGYSFLRLNRFNIGNHPVDTLDKKIRRLVSKESKKNHIIEDVQNTAEDLNEGNKKKCSRCGKVKDISQFRDSSLKTGMGRVCRECKGLSKNKGPDKDKEAPKCPEHDVKMVLKKGKYGWFWGCPKFPKCRITKQHKGNE